MICYECFLSRERREAIGFCHFCSTGLCAEHADMVPEEIRIHAALVKTVVLPRKARRLLCSVCKAALQQPNEDVIAPHDERIYEQGPALLVH